MQTQTIAQDEMRKVVATVDQFASRLALQMGVDAEDVRQESLARFLLTGNSSCTFAGWLWKTVRSVALDLVRKQIRERKYLVTLDEDRFGVAICELADEQGVVRKRAWYETPSDCTDCDANIVIRVLDKLPAAQKELLKLAADGHGYAELASLTGTNIGTVRSRLHYARKKAQAALAAEGIRT